jgi:predicted O-methyltransferase YrrM
MKLDWRKCTIQGGSDEEYSAFDRIVGEHRTRLGRDLRICEIGSCYGRSTVLLAQHGPVLAIDLWGDIDDGANHPEMVGQNFATFHQAMREHGLFLPKERVFPALSTSAVLDILRDEMFDVIYIDADHHYEPVRLDIQRSQRHLAPSGLFMFHDYKRPGDNPKLGVNIAVDELLATGDYVIKEHVGGLLCLQRTFVQA